MPSISRDRPGKMAAATNVAVTTRAMESTPVTRGESEERLLSNCLAQETMIMNSTLWTLIQYRLNINWVPFQGTLELDLLILWSHFSEHKQNDINFKEKKGIFAS